MGKVQKAFGYHTHSEEYASMYANANSLRDEKKYDDALSIYSSLGNYSDCKEQVKQTKYLKAKSLATDGKYDEAIKIFTSLGEFQDSQNLASKASADQLYSKSDYAGAYDIYSTLDKGYQTHSEDYATMYSTAEQSRISGDYDLAFEQFSALGNYSDSKEKSVQCGRDKADALFASGSYSEAAKVYSTVGDEEKSTYSLYMYAAQLLSNEKYTEAAEQYTDIIDYKDSREQRYQVGLKAKEAGKLAEACSILTKDLEYQDSKENVYQIGVSASDQQQYETAIQAFTSVGSYKDASMRLSMNTYAWGTQLFDDEDYAHSAEVFDSMGDFSDASTRANAARYAAATALMSEGQFDKAAEAFDNLKEYEDSIEKANAARYSAAKELLDADSYEEAKKRFEELKSYSDSADMVKECDYRPAKALYDQKEWLKAINAFKDSNLQDYKDTNTLMNECRYQIGTDQMASQEYSAALTWLSNAGTYKDCEELVKECKYQLALALKADKKYDEAIGAFSEISDYADSNDLILSCHYLKASELENESKYEEAYNEYTLAGAYSNASNKAKEMAYHNGLIQVTGTNYSSAIEWFERAGEYDGAKEQILFIAEYYYTTKQYDLAKELFIKVKDTGNAKQRLYDLGQYYELDGNTLTAHEAYVEAGDVPGATDGADRMAAALYQQAETLMTQRAWEEAIGIYIKISGYQDADEKLKEAEKRNAAAQAAAAARAEKQKPFQNVGGYVTFGTYPQTSSGTDYTPIQWLVLDYDVENNKALLLSRYGLDTLPYNEGDDYITWETCSLRDWLNNDFLLRAFGQKEQSAILMTELDNGSENNTKDRIFLLSYAEAKNYFGVEYYKDAYVSGFKKVQKSCVAPTAYAKARGCKPWGDKYLTADGDQADAWWLRSPGKDNGTKATVSPEGVINYLMRWLKGVCVRPAFWLDLDSNYFEVADTSFLDSEDQQEKSSIEQNYEEQTKDVSDWYISDDGVFGIKPERLTKSGSKYLVTLQLRVEETKEVQEIDVNLNVDEGVPSFAEEAVKDFTFDGKNKYSFTIVCDLVLGSLSGITVSQEYSFTIN